MPWHDSMPRNDRTIWNVPILYVYLFVSFFLLLLFQCWSWQDRLFHCNRCHARENKAWKDCRYLWPRNSNESPEELHGSNRGPVHLYPWCTAWSSDMWKYRSASQKPVCIYSEADTDRSRRECHRNGTGIQGTSPKGVPLGFLGRTLFPVWGQVG